MAELPHVEVLRLEPGDVLVATVDRPLSVDELRGLRDSLAKAFPTYPVVVLDSGLKLRVARHDDPELGGAA